MVSMGFTLEWQDEHARHTSCLHAEKLNLWREIFPPEIELQLLDKQIGDEISHQFKAGELIQAYQKDLCVQAPESAFHRRFRKNHYIEPRAGRFYPRAFIAGTKGIYQQETAPFRLAEVRETGLTLELNHPLSDKDLTLGCRFLDIWEASDEHGGACQDIAEMVTINGPGMQSRWRGLATDFWSDIPFSRLDAEPDEQFYSQPRLTLEMDATAEQQITHLYQRLLRPETHVLDLMAGRFSHLPDTLKLASCVGLGMNQQELDANPRLTHTSVQDLNIRPSLPYEDASFDAVICSLSIEYLTNPFEVFAEVARILKPGCRFILTFSNQWQALKVIRLWEGCHEFERPGILLEYFIKTGAFKDLSTWSMRGLPKPTDGQQSAAQGISDPVHAVWGTKI